MTRPPLIVACLLTMLPIVAGCKIVKNPDPNDIAQTAAQMSDEERMAALAQETYEPKLLPYMHEKAQEIDQILPAIAANLDTAGEKLGIPKASEGSPWNFVAKGKGTVITSNRKSRAAKLELDVNGDSAADLTIQLGPVIKGTALRDSASFFVFTDFRDQIEFAKLARALNDVASAAIKLPDGNLIGKNISFTGAFSLPKQSDAILLVPVQIAVED
ncbi:DUF2291 domain-containing protein [uncultured Cohaesibacter sp.]|uniref:DUF2291 family protein n=1 Tax=uncultured Cohaesibacter sp. TaxID=1002546 RepID=UPI0029C95387|nr:DUF2291 domain-containing protein [uncultured Cohaesibacter sp.]